MRTRPAAISLVLGPLLVLLACGESAPKVAERGANEVSEPASSQEVIGAQESSDDVRDTSAGTQAAQEPRLGPPGPEATPTPSDERIIVHPPYETPTPGSARRAAGGALPTGEPQMTPRIVDGQARLRFAALPHSCSPAPEYEAALTGQLLTLRARPAAGPLSRCVTGWNLHVTIKEIPAGDYQVELFTMAADEKPRSVFSFAVP